MKKSFNLHLARGVFAVTWLMFSLSISARARAVEAQSSLKLRVGDAAQVGRQAGAKGDPGWESSAPQIVEVFKNGYVAGLAPGRARVVAQSAAANEKVEWLVVVEAVQQSLVDPTTLRQYPDEREFAIDGRKCFGSELNGQRASDPNEKRFTRSNRVINPKPLRADRSLDWELQPGTEVYDGAGVLMGTVPATLKVADRMVPVSMFNFGASKVLHGRICVYAFAVSIKPSPALAALVEAGELKEGKVNTSAWLPLDGVANKESLLERIGLGKARLPALPLEATGYHVTGGEAKKYNTESGEVSIVRRVDPSQKGSPPVPSHYLRRPSGTVNLVYSVPGFGLGGQGADSFLVSDALEFYPAKGAKVFVQPTYFPKNHPQFGKVAPQTMTFLYGAIKCEGSDPVYGWIAKEALAGEPKP